METIKVKTYSGTEVTLTLDDDLVLTAQVGNIVARVGRDDFVTPVAKSVWGVRIIGGGEIKSISIHRDYHNDVNAILSLRRKLLVKRVLIDTEARAPGFGVLCAAYANLSTQLDTEENYVNRGMATSIFSGKRGDVSAAEANVARLEDLYPVAKAYIRSI